MARRTKEQALATRAALLDAAERLFQEQGVSRTTLQDIALAAGVTRGAVYWHFADKGALIHAMLERVLLPLEAADAQFVPSGQGREPLQGLQQHLRGVFVRALGDLQARRVYAIVLYRMDFVGEMEVVLARLQRTRASHVALIEQALEQAGVPQPQRRAQALGLHAVVSGLFETWLLEGDAFDVVAAADVAVGTYLAGVAALLPPCPGAPA